MPGNRGGSSNPCLAGVAQSLLQCWAEHAATAPACVLTGEAGCHAWSGMSMNRPVWWLLKGAVIS